MDVNSYSSNSWQSFKKIFRIVEITMVLVFLTWATTRLPFAVRISCEYLRRLVDVVVSHHFVFMLSNALVLALFFKSRHLFDDHDAVSTEWVFQKNWFIFNSNDDYKEETVFQAKETILEVKSTRPACIDYNKAHRRSKSSSSESLGMEQEDHDCGGYGKKKKLVRSETEKQRRRDAGEEVADGMMSNEEFHRAIEDFIARQVKFHREEKLAIVLHGRT